MKEIYIGITKGSNTALYDAASSSEYLGRQWENNATALVFERPKEEEHSAMFLVFDTEYGERIGSVALGSGNTYIVPSEVTERSKVVMGITFVNGAHVINTQPEVQTDGSAEARGLRAAGDDGRLRHGARRHNALRILGVHYEERAGAADAYFL